MQVVINFAYIRDIVRFYDELKEKLDLPIYFGNNLDALHDVISGDLKMPLELVFINMTEDKILTFKQLIKTLEDLTQEVPGFKFTRLVNHTLFNGEDEYYNRYKNFFD